MSKEYLVVWAIDMDADSPEEAAAKALTVMRDPESSALYFEVKEHGTTEPKMVDLFDREA